MLACIQGSVCWYVFKKLQVYIQGIVCVSKHGRMDASMCTVKEGNCRYVFKELYVLVIMIAPVAVSMLVCGRHGRVHAGML